MSIVPQSAKLTRKAGPATKRSNEDGGRIVSGRALQKGQQTKMAIVDAALGLATQIGL
ncbi:MAG: TetR/AcrR family transcriptional regulator, partial [Rhodoferax sp.]